MKRFLNVIFAFVMIISVAGIGSAVSVNAQTTVKRTSKHVYSRTKHGTAKTWRYSKRTGRKIGHGTRRVTVKTYRKTKYGTKKVFHKVKRTVT